MSEDKQKTVQPIKLVVTNNNIQTMGIGSRLAYTKNGIVVEVFVHPRTDIDEENNIHRVGVKQNLVIQSGE